MKYVLGLLILSVTVIGSTARAELLAHYTFDDGTTNDSVERIMPR